MPKKKDPMDAQQTVVQRLEEVADLMTREWGHTAGYSAADIIFHLMLSMEAKFENLDPEFKQHMERSCKQFLVNNGYKEPEKRIDRLIQEREEQRKKQRDDLLLKIRTGRL